MIDTVEECQEAVDELFGSGNTVTSLGPAHLYTDYDPTGCIKSNTFGYSLVDGAYGAGTLSMRSQPICKKPEPPAANGGGGTS